MNEIRCIDALIGLAELPEQSADIIIADPPYNIGKDFGGTSNDNMPIKDYVDWCDKWLDTCVQVLKDSGTMYIYGFAEILAHLSIRLPYPLEHRWLVWSYKNKTVPRLNFWQRSHESILCCWKYENQRIFNTDAVREPYTDTFLKNAAGKVRKGTKGRYSHEGKETIYNANEHGALPRDVINCSALAGGAGAKERWFYCKTCGDAFPNKLMSEHMDHITIHHPTQKPYELTKRLLLAAKPQEGGVVVVPFVGSGSECAVSADLGMQYLGFETNEDYIKLAEGFLHKRVIH